jgi:hypothetical protein
MILCNSGSWLEGPAPFGPQTSTRIAMIFRVLLLLASDVNQVYAVKDRKEAYE